jgi:hypothetical protein
MILPHAERLVKWLPQVAENLANMFSRVQTTVTNSIGRIDHEVESLEHLTRLGNNRCYLCHHFRNVADVSQESASKRHEWLGSRDVSCAMSPSTLESFIYRLLPQKVLVCSKVRCVADQLFSRSKIHTSCKPRNISVHIFPQLSLNPILPHRRPTPFRRPTQ